MAAPTLKIDPFVSRDTFETGSGPAGIYRLSKLEEMGLTRVDALPYSIRVLLESLLRNCDGYVVSEEDVKKSRQLDREPGRPRPRRQRNRSPLPTCSRCFARFYWGAGRRRFGRDAQRHAAPRR